MPLVKRIALAQFGIFQLATDGDLELIKADRLGQVLDGTGLDQTDGVADRTIAGQHDDRELPCQHFHQLRRIGIRQAKIEKDEIRFALGKDGGSLSPAQRTNGIQTHVPDLLDEQPVEHLIIIDGGHDNPSAIKAAAWVATLGALLVLLYTGMEVMVVEARALWNTPLLPLIFAVTAMTGGIGMTALMEAFTGNRQSAPLLNQWLARAS